MAVLTLKRGTMAKGGKNGNDGVMAHVFDAYGTLFDVHSAVNRHAGSIGPDATAFSALWRTKQLEYSWVHALMGHHEDFWTLTERALDFAFDAMPQVSRTNRDDLLAAYETLDCYPEVRPTLQRLKDSGSRLAILSNGSFAMLEKAVESADIGGLLHDIFSVDAIATFKTDPAVYRMVTDEFDMKPSAISFQSSNRWDIAGAVSFGFRCCWINRTGVPDEYPGFAPNRILKDLNGI